MRFVFEIDKRFADIFQPVVCFLLRILSKMQVSQRMFIKRDELFADRLFFI